MVSCAVDVCSGPVNKKRLPDVIREGALLLTRLRACGILKEAAERVQVVRQGGYCGVDALVYLLLSVSLGQGGGLRELWVRLGEHAEQVGALADRDSLMSSSSVSRLLKAVQKSDVSRFSRWLLLEASGARKALQASVAQTLDGQGDPKRLLAFDPFRVAIRKRALPEGDRLPRADRRAKQLAAPGRTARKRGEVVFSAGVLEDLGTGTVLDVSVSPGNGDAREMFGQAVDTAVATANDLGEDLASIILLADGEFGTVPHLSRCIEAGLPIVTRSARYELLDCPDVRQRLLQGRWERVEDSGSGPVRYAVEAGIVRIPPGVRTRRENHERFDPVDVRLVVSRYPAEPEDSGSGHQIGENRYELIVSFGVPPSSFSAGDLVTAFYARCGQECSIEQHQRELGIQTVFSNNPAGELFGLVVAYFVWNLRLVAGIQLSPPLPPRARPSPRVVETAGPPADLLPIDPEPTEVEAVESSVKADPLPADPELAVVDATIVSFDWAGLLGHRPGWDWDPQYSGIRTPDGALLAPARIEHSGHRSKLRFIGWGDDGRRLQATVALSPHLEGPIAAALRSLRTNDRKPSRPTKNAKKLHSPRVRFVAPSADSPLPFAIDWPQLLRAAARNVLEDLSMHTTVMVHLRRAPPGPDLHPLVQPVRARRQHRRLTWDERLSRHQSTGRISIRVQTTSQALASWMSAPPVDLAAGKPRR